MFGTTSTAASQYLHPDYLSPLPTTLDAKKSPLALLAQTCNSIGKEISPGRPVVKSSSSSFSSKEGSKDSSRSTKESPWRSKDQQQQQSKPGDDPDIGDKHSANSSPAEPDVEGPDPKSNQSSSGTRCESNGGLSGNGIGGKPPSSSGSSGTGSSGATGNRKCTSKEKASGVGGSGGQRSGSHCVRSGVSPKRDSVDSKSGTGPAASPNKLTRFNSSEDQDRSSVQRPEPKHSSSRHPRTSPTALTESLSHLRPAAESGSPSKNDCLSPLVLSYLTGMPAPYPGHQVLPSIDALSKFPSPCLSAYMAYLQSKGGISPCKDPFCTECPSILPPLPFTSMALIDKSLGPQQGLLRPPYTFPLHDRPCPSGSVALDSPQTVYSGSIMGSTLPHAGLSNIWACPWVTPDGEYCGKRCVSAEELLIHTRSHWPSTRLATTSGLPSAFPSFSGFLGYQQPYYPLSPSINSFSLLRQAYGSRNSTHGSIFSSPLGASASRFHPYKSPFSARSLSSPPSSFDLYSSQGTTGATAP